MSKQAALRIANVFLQFNRALYALATVVSLISLSKLIAMILFPPQQDLWGVGQLPWSTTVKPFAELILTALVTLIFHRAVKLLASVRTESGFSIPEANRLIRLLLIEAPLQFVSYLILQTTFSSSLWNSLNDASFMAQRSDDLGHIMTMMNIATAAYNVLNIVTIHLEPMSSVLFAILLLGVKASLQESRALRDDLATVI